jgi:hypothetical protein
MPADPPPTTIALADTRWVGHHPTYFREFAGSLRRLGLFVIALCPQPEDLAAADTLHAARLEAPNGGLLTPLDNDPASTLVRWWATRRALDDAEDACGRRADLVFFPYLDSYLRFLPSPGVPDLVLGRPWSGLYFRNQHLGHLSGSPGARFKQLAKGDRLLRSRRALPLVGVLDERFNDDLARQYGRTALPFPDITDETPPNGPVPLAETLRALARGRPIIGLAGSLEKRKGLLTLLRTAEASAAAGDDWFFAAVGTFADETFTAEERAWIETLRHRLSDSVFLDMSRQRIPDGAPYNTIFSAFDVSWAAYEGFQGSSNTLTKAALFEKPVVATAGECIGARVETHTLGATFPECDHAAARDAIARVLAEEGTGQARRGHDTYRRFHSRAHLDTTFAKLIDSLPRAARPDAASL